MQGIDNAFPDVILLINEDGLLIDTVTGQKDLLIEDIQKYQYKNIDDLFPEETASQIYSAIDSAIKTRTTQIIEYTLDVIGGRKCFETRIAALPEYHNQKRIVVMIARDITIRKKIEEKLQSREERYRSVFNEAIDGIVLINADTGMITECNPEFEKQTGRTQKELLNMKVWELRPPEKVALARSKFLEVRKQGQGGAQELEFLKPDGTITPIELLSKRVIIDGRDFLQSVTRDISERKKTEETLLISDAALRSIHECVFVMDNEIRVTYWNELCEKTFGIKASEAIGSEILNLIELVEEYPGQNEERRNTLLRNRHNREDQRYRTPTGDIWMDVHTQAIERNGQPYGWITLAVNITERKKVEETLQISDATLKSINECVFVMDKDNTVTYWNGMCEKTFGIKNADIIGKPFPGTYELLEEYPGQNEERWQLLKEKGYNRAEERIRTQKGDVIWMDINIQSVVKDGKWAGWLTLATDITERKRAEEILRLSDTTLRSIHDAVYAMDNNFIITYWNKTCEDIFSIPANGAIGQFIGDVLEMHEDYPGQNQERIDILLGKGYNWEEQQYITPKGKVWVDVRVQAIEQDGIQYGWVTLINDITERKRIEEELKLSEERFSKAFRSVPDSILITRIDDGYFLEVNDSFTRLTGYRKQCL
jgi:PAS domain S-box-containing protein